VSTRTRRRPASGRSSCRGEARGPRPAARTGAALLSLETEGATLVIRRSGRGAPVPRPRTRRAPAPRPGSRAG
jgi:hypothetical protein